MIVRKMTAADYEVSYALWLSVPGMGLNDFDDSREGIEKYLRRNPETCFVAEEDGKLVGTILSGHDGRRGYIGHTAVGAAYRNRGVGSALVESALGALRAQGIRKVSLVVFKTNETGNAFWEKRGFVVRGDLNYRDRTLGGTP